MQYQLIWRTRMVVNLQNKYSAYRYDYAEMREGGDDESPLIGRYCGDTLPSEHVSSGNEIYVRFKTDHSVSGTGFRIRYDLSKAIRITYRFPIINN